VLSSDLTLSIPAATASVDGYATSTQIAKLDGIESGADVTDATNVAAAGAVMDSDFAGSHAGRLKRTGVGTYEVIKDNNATAAPGEDDDSSEGYVVGSRWLNGLTGALYECVDATEGAAVWPRVDNAIPLDVPISSSDTTIEIVDSHHGRTILCTADTEITIEVPSALSTGVRVRLYAMGAGQIVITGTGSPPTSILPPPTFAAKTNEQYSPIEVYKTDGFSALVSGDLAAA
jgi:hypothetical protein